MSVVVPPSVAGPGASGSSPASGSGPSKKRQMNPMEVDAGKPRVRDLTSKRVKMPSPSRSVDGLVRSASASEPGQDHEQDQSQWNQNGQSANDDIEDADTEEEVECEADVAPSVHLPSPVPSVFALAPLTPCLSIELICSPSTILERVCPELVDQMWVREKRYQPNLHYFSHHPHLDPSMRPILIDWMIEVAQEFTLGRETLHLAVNYVDRYLSKNPREPIGTMSNAPQPPMEIHRSNLQLLGVACLFIASKLEEIYPPNSQDFATTTDGAYTPKQIDSMEREILRVLNWNLHSQTPFSWCKLFIQLICHQIQAECSARLQKHRETESETQSQSQYYHSTIQEFTQLFESFLSVDSFLQVMLWIDMAAVEIQFLRFFPSAIAASALMLYHSNHPQAIQFIEFCTGYSRDVLRPCMAMMQYFTGMPRQSLSLAALKKPYFEELRIPRCELYARQQHCPEALDFVAKVRPQMKNALSAAIAANTQKRS